MINWLSKLLQINNNIIYIIRQLTHWLIDLLFRLCFVNEMNISLYKMLSMLLISCCLESLPTILYLHAHRRQSHSLFVYSVVMDNFSLYFAFFVILIFDKYCLLYTFTKELPSLEVQVCQANTGKRCVFHNKDWHSQKEIPAGMQKTVAHKPFQNLVHWS